MTAWDKLSKDEEKIEAIRRAITDTVFAEQGVENKARLSTRLMHAVEKAIKQPASV